MAYGFKVASEAIIRQCPDDFLKNYIFIRFFLGVKEFVNGVDESENFDVIKSSVTTISSHLCVTDEGVIDKEVIQNELANYNHESQHAEGYVAPPDDVLCKGYECILCEKFTCIFEEMKTTGTTKYAIVIKRDFLYHLCKEFHDTHLRSVGGE